MSIFPPRLPKYNQDTKSLNIVNTAYKTALVHNLGIQLGYNVQYDSDHHGSTPRLKLSIDVLGVTFNVFEIYINSTHGVIFYIHEIPTVEDLFSGTYNPKKIYRDLRQASTDVADLRYVVDANTLKKSCNWTVSNTINRVSDLNDKMVEQFLNNMIIRKEQLEKADASVNITSSSDILSDLVQSANTTDPCSSN